MKDRIEIDADELHKMIGDAVSQAFERAQRLDGPMTRYQAAAYLQVHPDTLFHWAKDGMLPFSKLGDGERAPMRFHREDLDEFARNRRRVEANPQRSSGKS